MKQIKNIIFSKLYDLSHIDTMVYEKELSTEDSKSYVKMVISDLLTMKNTKGFCIRSESTEVISILCKEIPSYLNEVAATISVLEHNNLKIYNYSKQIAERFVRIERDAKDKYEANLKIKIRNGSLLTTLVETEDGYSYILAKIEHKPFIDTLDSNKHIGLPYENSTLKGCVINLNEEYSIIDIKVSDTGSTIAKYWSDDFLEFDEINNNERNTERAMVEINRVLNKYVKNKAEHIHLKQRMLGYFDCNEGYKHTEMTQALFSNFTLISEEVNIDEIKQKLDSLPEEKDFDANFEISRKIVDKKSKQRYDISDEITLNFKKDIPHIEDRIKSDIEEGIMLLKIYKINEDTYNLFKN